MKLPIWQYIINKLKTALAIVQDTDTATRAISQGKYVLWKGNLCQASSAIAQDDTLSASNLTALNDGIANVLGDHIGNVETNIGSYKLLATGSVSSNSSVNITIPSSTALFVVICTGFRSALSIGRTQADGSVDMYRIYESVSEAYIITTNAKNNVHLTNAGSGGMPYRVVQI